eukprot:8707846-Alexandrium_andersonii.AAC.1
MIGRLVAGWSTYPFCAVACQAGLRFRALSTHNMLVLLTQIGYHERVREWRRPVVFRPLTASDPGCRLRMLSLAAEAAAHCFALTGGAAEADAVGRSANRFTGNRFTAEEVVGDPHDRSGQQIMVRLAGEAD